jgi:hypothetical protein
MKTSENTNVNTKFMKLNAILATICKRGSKIKMLSSHLKLENLDALMGTPLCDWF